MTIFAGVDLGGTNTSVAIGTATGEFLAEFHWPTGAHDGSDAVLNRIADQVLLLAAGEKLEALGIGIPGLVDRERGVSIFCPNLPTQWRGVPVRDRLSNRLGCPVYLLNDVRTATLGELAYGRGRDVRNMLFFALGTGVGGGVVIDGNLHLGPLGAAGELGHQTILPDGPLCGCGNRGCLETLASGAALVGEGARLMRTGLAPRLYELTGGSLDRITPKEMLLASEAGDDAVRQGIVRAASYLGIGVANMVVALHPELVILGGGVAAIGGLLFDTVRTVVRERVGMFPVDGVRIEASALGEKAGLYGAIALAARNGLAQPRPPKD